MYDSNKTTQHIASPAISIQREKSDAMERREANRCLWWSSLCYGYRYLPLGPDENTSCHHRAACRRLRRRSSIIAVGASALALTAMTAMCMLSRPTSLEAGRTNLLSFSDGFRDETDDNEFIVRVHDSLYIDQETMELYPWEHLAEPWRKITMQIMTWPSTLSEEDTEFR